MGLFWFDAILHYLSGNSSFSPSFPYKICLLSAEECLIATLKVDINTSHLYLNGTVT